MRLLPGFEELGLRERLVLNDWPAEPHTKEAEYRKATCTENATRGVLECRRPPDQAVIMEIDTQRPQLGLYLAAPPDPCRFVITSVAGRRISVHTQLDCTNLADWPARAAEIERRIAELHQPQ